MRARSRTHPALGGAAPFRSLQAAAIDPTVAVNPASRLVFARTPSTATMTLASTSAPRTTLDEMLDFTTTSSTFARTHKWTSLAPPDAHDARFTTFPSRFRISSVEDAPDFWTTGAVD